jgi:hypothetical protein
MFYRGLLYCENIDPCFDADVICSMGGKMVYIQLADATRYCLSIHSLHLFIYMHQIMTRAASRSDTNHSKSCTQYRQST